MKRGLLTLNRELAQFPSFFAFSALKKSRLFLAFSRLGARAMNSIQHHLARALIHTNNTQHTLPIHTNNRVCPNRRYETSLNAQSALRVELGTVGLSVRVSASYPNRSISGSQGVNRSFGWLLICGFLSAPPYKH
jgi:hypothetical protein